MHPFEQGIFDRLMTGEPWTFDVRGTDKVIHIEAHLDDDGENIQSVEWGVGTMTQAIAFSDTPKNEDWPHHLMLAINEEVEEVNYNPAEFGWEIDEESVELMVDIYRPETHEELKE